MNKSPILKGAIVSYITVFINIIISFFYTPWMIKQIGVSDYGIYSLVSSFIAYFLMDFGLSMSITRFIAKYRAEKNTEKILVVYSISERIFIIIDIIILLVLFITYFFLSDIFKGLTEYEILKLKNVYCIAVFFSIANFVFKPISGALDAFEYFVENKILNLFHKITEVILLCIALLLKFGVYALVFIHGITALITSVSKLCIFTYKTKLKINLSYFDKLEAKSLFAFSIWTFLIGLAQRFRLSMMISLLGITSNSNEISLFALGMTFEAMIFTISHALNGLFLPKVSRLVSNDDNNAINELFIKLGRIQLYIFSLIYSGFLVFGQDFIRLWVGEKFSDVYYIVLLLTLSNIVSLTQYIASNLVLATNMINITAKITFICSGGSLILAVFLSKRYGAVGCAICTAIGLCLELVFYNIFYNKKLKLDIKNFFIQCHLKILPIIIGITIIGILVKSRIAFVSWKCILIGVILYTIVYASVIYFIIMNEYEKNILMQLIYKRREK